LPDDAITVYPNPAKSEVNIAFPKSFTGNLNLSIYDLTGKLIINKRFNMEYNYESLDISAFSPGYYIVQLQSENGKINRQKLVVK
jgi:hypothetical protein